MDKITELAQFFRDRDNPSTYDITTAKVTSISPLVLKISDKIFLSKEYGNLKVSASLLKNYERKYTGSEITSDTTTVNAHSHTLTTFSATLKAADNDFKIGDELIVIPIQNGEIWYAVDRLGVI